MDSGLKIDLQIMEHIQKTEEELQVLQRLLKEKQDFLFCLICESKEKDHSTK